MLFLIRSLHIGGTERQLVTIAKGLDKSKFKVHVGLLYGEGKFLDELSADSTVNIVNFDKKGRWDLIKFGRRLIRFIGEGSFDIIYSFLPDVNLISLVAAKAARRDLPLIWGIRASNMELSRYGWLPRLTYRLQSRLSGLPDAIVSNSDAGMKPYIESRSNLKKLIVIPNGIDIQRFCPDGEARRHHRNCLGISDQEYLIGMVARIDPMKDYETFIKAIAVLHAQKQNLRFICIGSGANEYRCRLLDLARRYGIERNIIWYGSSLDMPPLFNALDVACSTSLFGEGFSNVIAEAMACGIPCVVTDVGDSKKIVGGTGVVVPPGEPEALAIGVLAILKRKGLDGDMLGQQARQRIVENFSMANLVGSTSALLQDIYEKSIIQ